MVDEKWTVVTQASTDIEAQILRGMLEAQGIPVVLSSEGYGNAMGQLVPIDILVPNETIAQARKLMEEYYSGSLVDYLDDDPDSEEADEEDLA
jgi:hypothetical protein